MIDVVITYYLFYFMKYRTNPKNVSCVEVSDISLFLRSAIKDHAPKPG